MKAFYRAYFDDPFDPVMWVPVLSPDLGLRGVVFLRDTRGGARELDGRVDVYGRGVLVGQDVPGLVPRLVGLQSAILECDDLPLVVSRGGVRGDEPSGGVIALVAEALTQELALALRRMVAQDRAEDERLWPEIGSFVRPARHRRRPGVGSAGRGPGRRAPVEGRRPHRGVRRAAGRATAPDVPVLLAQDEALRRTGDLAQLFGLVDGHEVATGGLVDRTLVLNTASPFVAALAACQDPATRELAIGHLVDLALLEGSENDPGLLTAHLYRARVLLEHYLVTYRPHLSPDREKDTP